jgi:putative glutamine amidotransferase
VLYAAEPEVEPNHDPARDAFESAIIDEALRRRVPLLGICRGAQLLNVRLGGTLFQELASRRSKTSNRWTVLPLKSLSIEEDTHAGTLPRPRAAG